MIFEWAIAPLCCVNVHNPKLTVVKYIEENTGSAAVIVHIYTRTNAGGKNDPKDTRIPPITEQNNYDSLYIFLKCVILCGFLKRAHQ